jgi:hypothetical protein
MGFNIEEQLLALRGLTAIAGCLHDAQLLQIKMWGAVAFAPYGKDKWEAEPDLDTKTINFKILTKKHVGYKKMAPYVHALDNSIHWLLGDDWAISIEQDGRELYRGDRKQQDVNEQRKARASAGTGSSSS